MVECAAERARRRHPDVDVSVEVTPEDAVIALLYEGRNAQALITGERGRGGLTGLLLGSVSLAVAARDSCPVIVVRGDRACIEGVRGRILVCVGEPGRGGGPVCLPRGWGKGLRAGCRTCLALPLARPRRSSAHCR
ncbi:universal stress protein [Streptomyces sp. NBC_01320]|uniref:universal stress protein n=1 Tax=Streptomyces sp. NBC_01320 TaxID=2903824 RepID=UPI003FA39E4A